MDEPADAVLPMLIEMRAENKALHGDTAKRLDLIERRLKKLEERRVEELGARK
jgi:hypothetical protein